MCAKVNLSSQTDSRSYPREARYKVDKLVDSLQERHKDRDLKSKKPNSFLSQTMTVFDWDDTLLASTCLASMGVRITDVFEKTDPILPLLDELEKNVISILREAKKHGVVVILTNAESGWVELSGKRFLSGVIDFVHSQNIQIISARSEYEAQYPNSPSAWKAHALASKVRSTFPDQEELNVLVLGDSLNEREAAHALAADMSLSRVKTVKFVERPTIEQLQRQITLVLSSFVDLCDHDGSFDVNLVC